MSKLSPASAREQAEKMCGPSASKAGLFDLWYFQDAECEISGPITEAAIFAAKQRLTIRDEAAIEQAASIAVDAVFMSLGLTPDMVAGLLNGSCKVVKVH